MDNEEIISVLKTMAIKHMKAWDMIQEELQEIIDNEDADKEQEK